MLRKFVQNIINERKMKRMANKTYLTDIDDLFAQDLQDPIFANDVKAELNKLNSAVAVRNEREAYGWTQHDLAEKSGLPQSTIARVENGANTSMDTISKIANAFGKSIQISFA